MIANVVTNCSRPNSEPDVDVAEDLGGHEVRRVGREQDEQQVPGQEGHGHREGERAEPPLELHEFRGGLGLLGTPRASAGAARSDHSRCVLLMTGSVTAVTLGPIDRSRQIEPKPLPKPVKPAARGRPGAARGAVTFPAMPGRLDGSTPPPVAVRPQRLSTAQRVSILAVLLLAVSAIRMAVNEPSLALSLYILLPVVLSVFWFDLAGGLLAAAAATLLFLADELVSPSEELAHGMLWVAAVNRALPFTGVAVLVALLLRRERALTTRVQEQQDQLTELEGLRAALVPAHLPETPHLEIATSFTPADGLVAGDFFLVTPGPSGTTTVAIGDVVGHGIEAARCAAFVRAALATFARFTSDPAQLLQLANIALVEHASDGTPFVTAVCVNIVPAPVGKISWAAAGHDVPWLLDSGDRLPGGRVGAPLGTGPDALKIETGRVTLRPGEGILAFTDGLTEGRTLRRPPGRPVELFGEERAKEVVRDRAGARPGEVLEALSEAVQAFAGGPLADDLCLVALRLAPPARGRAGARRSATFRGT